MFRRTVALLFFATALSSAACSSQDVDSPWGETYEELATRVHSPKAKGALEDYWISDLELQASQSHMLNCFRARGFNASIDEKGALSIRDDGYSIEDLESVENICFEESGWMIIEHLYHAQRRNPQALDEGTLMTNCLKSAGAIAEDFTPQDYNTILEESVNSGAGLPETLIPFTDSTQGPVIYAACLESPAGR